MERIKISCLVFFIILSLTVKCQTEITDILNTKLIGVNMVSDGISRYSEPKISPNGTRILTVKNKNTLIYIDINTDEEVTLLTGFRYSYYCWIDNNTIYYYKSSEKNSIIDGELGKLTIQPFVIKPEFTFSSNRNGSGYSERISYLRNGKHDIYYDLERDQVILNKNGNEIEVTQQPGVYYSFLVSNNEKRVIIHKNDGKAYNYDLKGSKDFNLITGGMVTSWSPKDRYLLYFDSHEEDGDVCKSELYICTPDGQNHKQITFSDNICEFFADWAKNSNTITFMGHQNYQIYKGEIVVDK